MKSTHTTRENWRTDKPDPITWKPTIIEQIALGLAIVAIIFGAAGYVSLHWGDLSLRHLLEDFYANASTELLSIAITVLIVARLTRFLIMEERKQELILQMGNPENGYAREAVRRLRHYDWLTDGTLDQTDLGSGNLQGAFLQFANLQGSRFNNANLRRAMLVGANLRLAQLKRADLLEADLAAANLCGAHLQGVNLQRAALMGTNLRETNLTEANLQGAICLETDLQAANLSDANLRRAMLVGANLRLAHMQKTNLEEADLAQADLQGANLENANLRYVQHIDTARFDTDTTLPNGDKWYDGYDLAVFTNRNHPAFWEAAWVTEWDTWQDVGENHDSL